MVTCKGCPAIVFFDNNLHRILLEERAKFLCKDVKDLTDDDLNTVETEGLGSGRPFNIGTKIVHKCPGYNKKTGWSGRENTVKKEINGYVYNISKTELKRQPKLAVVEDKPKPQPSQSKPKEEVIVFSEQSILDTQKQILREIQSLREQIFGNKT